MARGGMYDQLGGGFARYSVDDRWEVPHFEKMLYDNALLLRVYAHWARQEGSELADRVARETADFMLRELRTPEGGFASALDADTDGAEGTFYVWTPRQLIDVLGLDEGAGGGRAVRRHRRRQLRARRVDAAADPRPGRLGTPRRRRTPAARCSRRAHPPGSRRQGGGGLERPGHLGAGRGVARPRRAALSRGRRARRPAAGRPPPRRRRPAAAGSRAAASSERPAGVLEDYAAVAEGFLTLYGATGDAGWFERGTRPGRAGRSSISPTARVATSTPLTTASR